MGKNSFKLGDCFCYCGDVTNNEPEQYTEIFVTKRRSHGGLVLGTFFPECDTYPAENIALDLYYLGHIRLTYRRKNLL